MSDETRGRIEVTVELLGEFSIADLTDGWSEDELRELAEGDEEAITALEDEARSEIWRRPAAYAADAEFEITLAPTQEDTDA